MHFLQLLVGAIVWAVANVVYVDMKRKGRRGFTRFAAFWAGTPTTWVTFFAVQEGHRPTFEPPDDEERALFDEIRRDRALRAGERDEAEGSAELAAGTGDRGAEESSTAVQGELEDEDGADPAAH